MRVGQSIDTSATLGALATERPLRIRLFERLRLDYCCGGSTRLDDACEQRGLDLDSVREQLEAIDRDGPALELAPDWNPRQASIDELCEHIVSAHHAPLREEMPRIGGLLEKVVRVHGAGRPDLELVERTFASLRLELEEHIDEEELVLFPACRALEQDTGAVDRGLIDRHRTEHVAVGRKLLALRELAGGYELSRALCSTHRSLLEALERLEADLHRHVHEENNVLLPRVEALFDRSPGEKPAVPMSADVLIDALVELADAGRPERAARLAAAAYADLRRREPERARRLDALMHKLILSPRHINGKEKQMPTTDPDLDVRNEPPARRHELIFETWEGLAEGEGFVLVNDHDPKPLEYQFAAEHAGQFTWDYLEQGPQVWRVRIGRAAKATA